MPGTDLTSRLTGWVQDAIDAAALGEEFPYCVVPGVITAPGATAPVWAVLIMYRSPVLGAPPFTAKIDVPPGVVQTGNQENITEAAHGAMGQLREAFTQALRALKNGGPAPVTGGPGVPGGQRKN